MKARDSLLAGALEPLAGISWALFVLISLAVAADLMVGGNAMLTRQVDNRDLLRSSLWMLDHLDLAWIVLAAANVYASVAERTGLAWARRWSLLVLIAVTALAWLNNAVNHSGAYFQGIQYSSRLGMKLGPVPIGVSLLWLAIILSAREAVLRCFQRWNHGKMALGVGALVAITDLNLEPLAAKVRGFWFWRPGMPGLPPVFNPPPTTWLEWGVVGGLLAYAVRERNVAASSRLPSWQPMVALIILNAVFLCGHLGRWLAR